MDNRKGLKTANIRTEFKVGEPGVSPSGFTLESTINVMSRKLIDDFIFDKRRLFLFLYEQLTSCSYHPYEKTIEFTLQHVNGAEEHFTFVFHNKRELIYQGLNNIYTRPWRISDFKAPV